jgi:hypothetical protein
MLIISLLIIIINRGSLLFNPKIKLNKCTIKQYTITLLHNGVCFKNKIDVNITHQKMTIINVIIGG